MNDDYSKDKPIGVTGHPRRKAAKKKKKKGKMKIDEFMGVEKGRRIVRTAAGALKYGKPIGSVIRGSGGSRGLSSQATWWDRENAAGRYHSQDGTVRAVPVKGKKGKRIGKKPLKRTASGDTVDTDLRFAGEPPTPPLVRTSPSNETAASYAKRYWARKLSEAKNRISFEIKSPWSKSGEQKMRIMQDIEFVTATPEARLLRTYQKTNEEPTDAAYKKAVAAYLGR